MSSEAIIKASVCPPDCADTCSLSVAEQAVRLINIVRR